MTHLVVCEATLKVRIEFVHVLAELRPACIGEGADGQHGFLMDGAAVAGHDADQSLHDAVSILRHRCLAGVLVTQLLDDHLEHSTQQPLREERALRFSQHGLQSLLTVLRASKPPCK